MYISEPAGHRVDVVVLHFDRVVAKHDHVPLRPVERTGKRGGRETVGSGWSCVHASRGWAGDGAGVCPGAWVSLR